MAACVTCSRPGVEAWRKPGSMGFMHSRPQKSRTPVATGVCDVAWVTQPPGPIDIIECDRYSPMAAMTSAIGPGPCTYTVAPFGTFHPLVPAGMLPQAGSAAAE